MGNRDSMAQDDRKALIDDVLQTESNWLRQAKFDLMRRDPLDAYNDVLELEAFAKQVLDGKLDVARQEAEGENP